MTRTRKLLLDGLRLGEAPRWYDGRLWLSDMVGGCVRTVDLDGRSEVVAAFDDQCGGIDFLPDGSLLVVLRDSKRVVRVNDGAVTVHADLSGLPSPTLNDLLVDAHGRAYVGGFASRPEPSTDDRDELLIVLDESGAVLQLVPGMVNPNGMAITPAGDVLIVAESRRQQLTSFRVRSDGTLTDRALYASTGDGAPDGICLDAEGAVWIGSPNGDRFYRFAPGGELLDTIETPGALTVACALGGPDGRTLFLVSLASDWTTLRQSDAALSRVETVTVPVPAAAIAVSNPPGGDQSHAI
jgi:sugar lactone lactonase YvrE